MSDVDEGDEESPSLPCSVCGLKRSRYVRTPCLACHRLGMFFIELGWFFRELAIRGLVAQADAAAVEELAALARRR